MKTLPAENKYLRELCSLDVVSVISVPEAQISRTFGLAAIFVISSVSPNIIQGRALSKTFAIVPSAVGLGNPTVCRRSTHKAFLWPWHLYDLQEREHTFLED